MQTEPQSETKSRDGVSIPLHPGRVDESSIPRFPFFTGQWKLSLTERHPGGQYAHLSHFVLLVSYQIK